MKMKTTKLKFLSLDAYYYNDSNKSLRTEDDLVKPLFLSLFAGTGGSSLGYHHAGYKEVLAIDNDSHAVECFRQNFPDVNVKPWNLEIKTPNDVLEELRLKEGETDTLDGSSSCVNLSGANTQAKLYATSNLLLLKLAQFVAEIQPKTFLFENVKGLLAKRNRALLLEFQRRLNMLNYVWGYVLANAEEYGVPQARRRVIFIGVRNDVYLKATVKNFFPQPNLSEVKNLALNNVLKNVIGYSAGQFADTFCYGNRPVCTITKTASLWLYDQNGYRRKPTTDELKKLSSFPDDFKLPGSRNAQWARIGNAVPPKLIEAFAKNLNSNFIQPYLASEFHLKDDYDRIAKIADYFKRNGFKEQKVKFKFCRMKYGMPDSE